MKEVIKSKAKPEAVAEAQALTQAQPRGEVVSMPQVGSLLEENIRQAKQAKEAFEGLLAGMHQRQARDDEVRRLRRLVDTLENKLDLRDYPSGDIIRRCYHALRKLHYELRGGGCPKGCDYCRIMHDVVKFLGAEALMSSNTLKRERD